MTATKPRRTRGKRDERPAKAKRGRPRNDAARSVAVEAALRILEGGDPRALTMENIAARAKVSKATLYRWWKSPSAIALEGLHDVVSRTSTWTPSTSLRETLLEQTRIQVRMFTETSVGCMVRRVVAESQINDEIYDAFMAAFIRPRQKAARKVLEDAKSAGEMRADVSVDTVLELVFAPIYMRLLVRQGPLDEAFVTTLVDTVLKGLAPT